MSFLSLHPATPRRQRAMLSIGVLLGLLPASNPLLADTLVMNNGDHISGEVLLRQGDVLKFKTAYAGEISVKWSEIQSVTTDNAMTLQLDNERVIKSHSITNQDEQTLAIKGEVEEQEMVLSQQTLTALNPEPWTLGEGYKFTGLINFSTKNERGNNDKDELDADADILFRRQRDRAKFSLVFEKDNQDGEATKNKWSVRGSYDYFPEKQWNYGIKVPKWFYGGTLMAQKDQFADLTLRLIAGPHIGYQFYEGHDRNLLVQTGVLRVHEQFQNDPDNDFWGAGWHIDYDQYLFNDITQFYHKQVGVYGIQDPHKLLWTSWTGFRVPLWAGFIASTEIEIEYDSEPASDADTTDTTYRLKLGYRW